MSSGKVGTNVPNGVGSVSTPNGSAASTPLKSSGSAPLLSERKEPPNLLVCQSWWKNCLVQGDQYKKYRHLYSKTTKLTTLRSKENRAHSPEDELPEPRTTLSTGNKGSRGSANKGSTGLSGYKDPDNARVGPENTSSVSTSAATIGAGNSTKKALKYSPESSLKYLPETSKVGQSEEDVPGSRTDGLAVSYGAGRTVEHNGATRRPTECNLGRRNQRLMQQRHGGTGGGERVRHGGGVNLPPPPDLLRNPPSTNRPCLG